MRTIFPLDIFINFFLLGDFKTFNSFTNFIFFTLKPNGRVQILFSLVIDDPTHFYTTTFWVFTLTSTTVRNCNELAERIKGYLIQLSPNRFALLLAHIVFILYWIGLDHFISIFGYQNLFFS